MRSIFQRTGWLAPVAMLVMGLLLGRLLPDTPLHATATDRTDTFLVATGPVDSDVEAVYFLDCLTGDLQAAVLGKRTGGFTTIYRYNVLNDFQVDYKINPGHNPKFLMVTGIADLGGNMGRVTPGASVAYVVEITSGRVAAYAVPWDRARWNAGAPAQDMLRPVGMLALRNAANHPHSIEEVGR